MKHSKKRNSALLYEFLIRTMSSALVEQNDKKSNIALKILKKHFKSGTEVYKEFRIINSLIKTSVSSPSVASSIIQEAKNAVRTHNTDLLDKEKSHLIKNINYDINDTLFFEQHVDNYKMFATIQTLINEWRLQKDADLNLVAQYEDILTNYLLTKKDKLIPEMNLDNSNQDRFVLKLMTKKLNEKYSFFSNSQKQLIRDYSWSPDKKNLTKKLIEFKEKIIEGIETYLLSVKDSDYFSNQLKEAKEKIVLENLEIINDDTINRFMLYLHLDNEIRKIEKS